MNPNMNMMQMPGPPMMQVSPMMQSSPQGPMQQQHQQQAEKMDNISISRVKTLLGPLRESMFLTIKNSAFTLQQNNVADNLKRDNGHVARFDKHLEDFYACCDQMELHLKTAMQCMQQSTSSQHYLPAAVTAMRVEPYHENPGGPISYPTYLSLARIHVQSSKDIHDTLISAAQNISQAD
ncbi:mediator of RNA polymerase II transcription subunit 29 [Scaptodrosophila lebanonensis]|uniref:Mediator of RNA polymerase II transcription subunit 29 n=1 Tax=Drosophila lebanonensis TaxID=7225 RepID=A0A6J2UGC9_DROLE|nr:mediator of RNA polymerase II transcription subunit 29 [Scaptodrosophila lebanonensis]